MKENRNDRQYGQTSSTQEQNLGSKSNDKASRSREHGSTDSQMGSEFLDLEDPENFLSQEQNLRSQSNESNQRSGEYSSSDEMDDLEDDEPISMLDEDDENMQDDDEDSQLNQRERQGSNFGSGDTQNR